MFLIWNLTQPEIIDPTITNGIVSKIVPGTDTPTPGRDWVYSPLAAATRRPPAMAAMTAAGIAFAFFAVRAFCTQPRT